MLRFVLHKVNGVFDIDLLVLDWSGVVSNDRSAVLNTVNAILKRFGKPCVSLNEFCSFLTSTPDEFYKSRGIHEDVSGLFLELFKQQKKPMPVPRAVEAVKALRKIVPIAVFSAHPEEEVGGDIERYQLEGVFNFVYAGMNKAEPKGLHRLLEKAGTKRERALYAGDTVCDISLAARTGISSVAVVNPNYAYNSYEQIMLHKPQPTYGIVNHLWDVHALLKNRKC